ncbi:hypothetical protein PPTG_04581 [Plasmopara halstedii]|uniref:Zinc finger PHD-type domain-containing protein n=1 Tax=Plasmopara halstedii TaxID=4781 RepID=A0A0P1AJD2_PLAHL|nr:hypothetical protein PPTG_04581 [Plasmopara halstedii]CEG41351.1 hypothetical protein PPTG_04581 [Plasmopara halstedii]|eukprot:XP_024577720.1 hypothetical protein PPTG_04581 [Plasmopara halstedii]
MIKDDTASSFATIMADSTLSCPVCFESYSPTEGSAFALHVSSCTRSSLSPLGSPSSSLAHCPLCLYVYTAGTPAHEISFHEHECARVNDLPDDGSDDGSTSTAASRNNKRQRNEAVARAKSVPSVTLFPSTCFLCGNGGRGLLHCRGNCARAAHQHCVDQLQAPIVGDPLSVSERRQAADKWKCAQCVRGLHRCQHCGFLGHEANGMRKCTVVNCGYHFHAHCLPEATAADFVCSRHICMTCGTQETNMKRCKSCSLCDHMTHLHCPNESGATVTDLTGLDPIHLFKCPRHDTETLTYPTDSFDATNSLRKRLAAGDVVLVLEFKNALLPLSAKAAAPDAANHWGVVVSAEQTEPHGRGNQLLSVRMFADDNIIIVPNQYALRVALTTDFSRPVDLIRHCLQRHAMVELQLRHMEGDLDQDEEKRILSVSRAAFAARLKAFRVTAAQATSDTEQGLALWRRFQELPQPRQYDGSGTSAPSFLFIDTRGRCYAQQDAASRRGLEEVIVDVDEDVTMADHEKVDSAINGIVHGSPHIFASSIPTDGEKNPHENKSMISMEKSTVNHDGAISPPQTCNQDAIIADRKVHKHDRKGSYQDKHTSTTVSIISQDISAHIRTMSNQASVCVVNSTKRTVNCDNSIDAKRQRTNLNISPGLKVPILMPIQFNKLQPGATLNCASVPATLHVSPMASRAILPPKRKPMTRKQKVLADMPPLLLKELEREAWRYLETADRSVRKPTRIPADGDAFPWAARAANLCPAFYRPTVMLGHSGIRRAGVDAVSRLLVSQDKRSIKCFVQTTENGVDMTQCSHVTPVKSSSASPGFVLLDLMTLHSFRDLELVIRSRLVEALRIQSRYTRNHFGMDVHQAQCWLERQRRRKVSEQPPVSLSYCTMSGRTYQLNMKQSSLKQSIKDKQAWVCFCANVCHLSVSIGVPGMSRAGSKPNASVAQHVFGTVK